MSDRTKFRIAVITFPLWVIPAAAAGVLWLFGWVIWSTAGLAMSGAFAALGKHEWSDRIAEATGWEDDGSW